MSRLRVLFVMLHGRQRHSHERHPREWQPTNAAGLGWLRRLRGKQAPASAAALANRLRNAARRYAQEHPDLTAEQVAEAASLVLGLVVRNETE